MKDSTYRLIARAIGWFYWKGQVLGTENLPSQGPAVFIGNHLDAAGPLSTATAIPLRLHYWVVADMMDKELAINWLQWDFIERQLHLKPPLSHWFSLLLCKIVIPLFYALEFIPVYREDKKRLPDSIRLTVDRLLLNQFVFIFPEDNRFPTDPITRMAPFQYTFVRVAELYYEKTHQCLTYIPVAIHEAGYVWIGKPVQYIPTKLIGIERRRMLDYFEKELADMYMQLANKSKGVIEDQAVKVEI